jgi:hypothetical protein
MSDFPQSLERINWSRVVALARGLKRSPIKRVRDGVRRGPADVPVGEWRNDDYLAFLRKCRCAACLQVLRIHKPGLVCYGVRPCDPAPGPVNGTSSKGPDREALPLCRPHHSEQTSWGWEFFESKYEFSREVEAAAHWARFKVLEAVDELD